jgi:hypothetical protein
MATTQSSAHSDRRPSLADQDAHRREEAIVEAEAHRLERSLAPYRVLSREALEEVAGCARWHDGASSVRWARRSVSGTSTAFRAASTGLLRWHRLRAPAPPDPAGPLDAGRALRADRQG